LIRCCFKAIANKISDRREKKTNKKVAKEKFNLILEKDSITLSRENQGLFWKILIIPIFLSVTAEILASGFFFLLLIAIPLFILILGKMSENRKLKVNFNTGLIEEIRRKYGWKDASTKYTAEPSTTFEIDEIKIPVNNQAVKEYSIYTFKINLKDGPTGFFIFYTRESALKFRDQVNRHFGREIIADKTGI
jgi:hypothetical protein